MNLQLLNPVVLFQHVCDSVGSFVLSGHAAPIALNLLLQTTLLTAFALLGLTLAHRRSPHLQTLIGRASALGVVLIIALNCLAGNIQPAVKVTVPMSVGTVEIPVTHPVAALQAPALPAQRSLEAKPRQAGAELSNSSPLVKPETKFSASPVEALPAPSAVRINVVALPLRVLLFVWITGAAVLLAWIAVCHLLILRIRLTSKTVRSGEAFDLLYQLWVGHRSQAPALLINPGISSPLLCGLCRPTILLPATYERDYDTAALRAVLLHELAHLRRRDLHWNLVARVLCALLWPQPLMWALRRRMEDISEEACDRAAVEGGCTPQEYATILLSMAERLSLKPAERAVGAGVVPFRSAVGRRVQEVLAARKTSRPSRRTRYVVALATLAIGIIVSFSVAVRAKSSPLAFLSTPEATVRNFVVALNGRDMERLSQCVEGAQPAADLTPLIESLKRSGQSFEIKRLRLEKSRGDVRLDAVVMITARNFSGKLVRQEGRTEFSLRRIDGNWKLLPTRASEQRPHQPASLYWLVNAIAGTGLEEIRAWAKAHGGAAIAGIARWDDGRPAANIKLRLNLRTNYLRDQPALQKAIWQMRPGSLPKNLASVFSQEVTTDPDGHFQASNLVEAPYDIAAPQGLKARLPDWVTVKGYTVTALRGRFPKNQEITITAGSLLMVKVAALQTGKKLPDVMVVANSPQSGGPSASHMGLTNGNGLAVLRVPPGNHHLTLGLTSGPGIQGHAVSSQDNLYSFDNGKFVVDRKHVNRNSLLIPITVGKDETHSVEFHLTPFQPRPTPTPIPTPDPRRQPRGDGIIVGRVITQNGQPATGVTVRATMQRQANWELWKTVGLAYGRFNEEPYASRWKKVRGMIEAKTVTDANGIYRLSGLTTAPYDLFVAKSKENDIINETVPEGVGVSAQGVWARDGQVIRRSQPLVITTGVLIRGEVIDKATKQPLGGVGIGYNGPQLPGTSDRVMSVKTDEEGHFEIRVSPGTTSLYIFGPAINDVNYVFADTKSPAGGVYRVQTNRGAYAGSHKVEYSIDNGPLRYGLDFGKRIDLEVKKGQSRFVSLHLRKIVPGKVTDVG